LDGVGRVVDFSVIKDIFCAWLEENWDHKMLLWDQDPVFSILAHTEDDELASAFDLVPVPFNPTAENMAAFLLKLGNQLLLGWRGGEAVLERVTVWETRKCCATAILEVPE
jgi:6-pyruvoyltetrahydropterin/6-carboxytetrahydropterin synthase